MKFPAQIHKLLILIIFLCAIALTATSQKNNQDDLIESDSFLLELLQIKKDNEVERIKDSIRIALLNEELARIQNPKLAELENYRNELDKIKKEDSIRFANQQLKIDALRNKVRPSYVMLYQDTVFRVFSGLGPFNAASRAGYATEMIGSLYEAGVFFPDSLKVEKQQGLTNIVYQDKIITSISQEDALWEQSNIDSLAQLYINNIKTFVSDNRIKHNTANTIIRWAKTLGIVASLIILLRVLKFYFGKIKTRIVNSHRTKTQGIKIRNYELISMSYLSKYFIRLLMFVRLVITLLLIYITLSFIFSIFPSTKNWTYILIHWIIDPLKDMGQAILDYIPNLFKIVVIIFLARTIARMLRFFSYEIQRNILKIKGFHTEWARPTYKISRFLLYIFAFILIFPLLPGADTAEFKGVSVFLGILFSLGSTSAIANTVAGFIITYMRPFKNGDWIKINDITGVVVEKTALVTRLRTINNEDVTVPNSAILSNHTINYSSSCPAQGLVLNANVNIRYEVPWEKVHELLVAAAAKTKDVDLSELPYVFQTALKDNFVSYQLNATTRTPERMYHILSDLYQNIQTEFYQAGIDIVVPQVINVKNNDK